MIQPVLISGFTVLIFLLLSACSSKAERQFMAGCTSGGTDSAQCSCVYDKLERHYGEDTMERLANVGSDMAKIRQQTPADFPEQVARAAYQCGAQN